MTLHARGSTAERAVLATQAVSLLTAWVFFGHSSAFAQSTVEANAALKKVETSAADEALYMERFRRLSEGASGGTGIASYDTMESVPGAKRVQTFSATPAGKSRIDSAALTAIETYAAESNSTALFVWHDGKLVLEKYFGSTRDDSLLNSRSLSKPFSVVAVGRAIALGKIRSVDQPVADFIGEWRNNPQRSKILLRHLLDMRAGFIPQRLATAPDDILNRTYLHPRFDELLINEFPLVAEPGSIYEYSQGVSDIVGIVIERATGRRYAEFISREVMQPLGARGGEVWVGRPGGMAHSGCCLQTPADTWLRLGILLLDDGVWRGKRLLPRGYVAEMRKPTLQNPYYGMGVFTHEPYIERRGFASPRAINVPGILHSEPYAAKDLFLFDGNGSQVVYMVPSQRLVIVRTGNARSKKPGLSEWDNTFIPNTVLRAIGR